MKAVFDDLDCLEECAHDTDVGRNLVWQYFGVDDQMDMLQFYYTKFEKSHIAGLTASMAKVRLLYTTDPLKCILILVWGGGGGLQPKKNRTLPQISNLGLVFFRFFWFFSFFFRFFHFGQF